MIDLYADGGLVKSSPSHIGGTWAYVLVRRETDVPIASDSGVILPSDMFGEVVTNNQAEFVAITIGLEAIPSGWSGTVLSDSCVTLGRLFNNWKMKNLPDPIIRRARNALARMGEVDFVLLSGHPTKAQLESGVGRQGRPVSKWNAHCDHECRKVANAMSDGLIDRVNSSMATVNRITSRAVNRSS